MRYLVRHERQKAKTSRAVSRHNSSHRGVLVGLMLCFVVSRRMVGTSGLIWVSILTERIAKCGMYFYFWGGGGGEGGLT